MAFTGLAIAAALAAAKNELVDQPAAKRARTLAAATQKYSPWTGLQAQPVQDPNVVGGMMQAGATGAMIGQGVENSSAQNNYLNSKSVSDGVADPNLSQSNTFMAGPNPYAGKDAVMDPNAGQAPTSMLGASTGGSGGPQDPLAARLALKDPYASLYAAGINPNPPAQFPYTQAASFPTPNGANPWTFNPSGN
jgi:hypothetical protein